MVKKRFNKKGQEGIFVPKYLLNILLIILIAIALYFMIRGIGNAFLPK